MRVPLFMKKKTAILIDAEWFRRILRHSLPRADKVKESTITAELFYRNALLALLPEEEELYRLFCYDCEPFADPQRNPIDQSWVRFGKTHPLHQQRMRFFRELGELPYTAIRRGSVKGRGWEVREEVIARLLKTPSQAVELSPLDIRYAVEQKGVDMRIGMDVATLSLKRLVERIILISGDTDMVPAIKLARREGIQVCVVHVGTHGRLAPSLIENADLLRQITPIL